MTRKGFTLLELLVVVGIMGLLGTASIGAYRSITRGMEERGALQNASQFMHAALQRAMIDRQPTAVYMWNETIRARTEDDNEIVVGKAVAVRRAGRISRVDGNLLQDEFADLNLTYSVADGQGKSSRMQLYKFPTGSEKLKRYTVHDTVQKREVQEVYLLDPADGSEEKPGGQLPLPQDDGAIPVYGFVCDSGSGDWKTGNAYGFEFMTIELPKNFIFGNGYQSDRVSSREVGSILFGGGGGGYQEIGGNASSGKTVDIYAIRQDSSGGMSAVKVGTTVDPTRQEEN